MLEMIEVNVMSAGVRFDLLKEAAAIAVDSGDVGFRPEEGG